MATIEDLKDEIIQHFQHPFLEKYVGTPYIDIDKLWIVKQMTSQLDSPHKEQYIYATMLVQIALDTHDTVERENKVLEYDQANRDTQLTVLAGDYFSGLYYHLLAKGENIELIQLLAVAIKEVNEEKFKLYLTNYTDMNMFFRQFLKVDFLVIDKVATFLDSSEIIELTFDLLYFKRLKDEYTYLENHNSSFIYERWIEHKNKMSLTTFKNELKKFIDLFEEELFQNRSILTEKVSRIYTALCQHTNISLVNI